MGGINECTINMVNYQQIGKLVATFGVKGELILSHKLGKKTNFKGLDALFVEVKKEELLPYFIVSAVAKSTSETLVLLEGVDSKEAAKLLTPKNVWLTEAAFQEYTSTTAPIAMLGYTMICDEEQLGEILEVIEQPHQILLRIDLNGNEALIPLHSETLKKVDKQKRIVYVTLPDGLLDIYR